LRRLLSKALAGLIGAAVLTAPLCGWSASGAEEPAQEQTQGAPPLQLGGTTSYEGLPVEDITLPGVSDPKAQNELLDLIPLKAGERLDRERIRQSIQNLYATGRFADIRAQAERTTDGRVHLIFVTSPNYFIGEVRVEGNPERPTAAQLENTSKLQLGELFTPEKLERALTGIKQLLEENGYYRATVAPAEEKHPETQEIGIVFHVTPGSQAHVGEVRITGAPGYSDAQVLDVSHLHAGDSVSARRINNSLDRLRKRYQKRSHWLAEVKVAYHTYRPRANAVDFTFDIDPGPVVHIITEGFKVSQGVLKDNIPVYEENALDDDLLNEGRRNLLNYLQGRGYFDAKVSVTRKTESAGKEMLVVYDIDAGAQHRVAKVEVLGNHYFDEAQLRALMSVQPAGRILSHGMFNQRLLNADVSGIENLYRANGFSQVKVTSEVTDNYAGRDNQLAVILHVAEGQQVVVGEFRIIGNAIIQESQLGPLNENVREPFSESRIADDRDLILNKYFNNGFPDATFEASAQPVLGQPNAMDVTYTIHEGQQTMVNQVLVSGLHFTRPFVVQRELQIHAGDPLSQINMLDTQRQLYDLGIFGQVDTAVQNPDGKERQKNVLVQLQEGKRYTFNYGIGLEFQTGQPAGGTSQPQGTTGVSPKVSFSVSRLNVRGRDHTLTFSAAVGRLQQRGLVSYEAPRWMNSPHWKLSLTAFYDDTVDVTTFTSERLEGAVQAEQTLSKSSSMEYRFTYRRVLATNLPPNLSLVPQFSQPTRVGGPGFTYIRDQRDNALESTKGNYLTIDGSLADNYFGSQRNFSRILVQHSSYYAFGKNRPQEKKFVFARSTRIGVETPFGNTVLLPPGQCPGSGDLQCIPLPELFLSGGGNSHRGFGLNQAGPRDPNTGFPLGGGALFLNNLEMRFPPVALPFVHDNLSFALFHDAGNVFVNGRVMLDNLLRWKQKDPELCLQASTAGQCDYSYISHAVGLGVRYKTPIGPVRFDFGYNLNPPAYPSHTILSDGTEGPFVPQHAAHFNVFFSIGQTF
jgi:outer membrane protein insertion porin family